MCRIYHTETWACGCQVADNEQLLPHGSKYWWRRCHAAEDHDLDCANEVPVRETAIPWFCHMHHWVISQRRLESTHRVVSHNSLFLMRTLDHIPGDLLVHNDMMHQNRFERHLHDIERLVVDAIREFHSLRDRSFRHFFGLSIYRQRWAYIADLNQQQPFVGTPDGPMPPPFTRTASDDPPGYPGAPPWQQERPDGSSLQSSDSSVHDTTLVHLHRLQRRLDEERTGLRAQATRCEEDLRRLVDVDRDYDALQILINDEIRFSHLERESAVLGAQQRHLLLNTDNGQHLQPHEFEQLRHLRHSLGENARAQQQLVVEQLDQGYNGVSYRQSHAPNGAFRVVDILHDDRPYDYGRLGKYNWWMDRLHIEGPPLPTGMPVYGAEPPQQEQVILTLPPGNHSENRRALAAVLRNLRRDWNYYMDLSENRSKDAETRAVAARLAAAGKPQLDLVDLIHSEERQLEQLHAQWLQQLRLPPLTSEGGDAGPDTHWREKVRQMYLNIKLQIYLKRVLRNAFAVNAPALSGETNWPGTRVEIGLIELDFVSAAHSDIMDILVVRSAGEQWDAQDLANCTDTAAARRRMKVQQEADRDIEGAGSTIPFNFDDMIRFWDQRRRHSGSGDSHDSGGMALYDPEADSPTSGSDSGGNGGVDVTDPNSQTEDPNPQQWREARPLVSSSSEGQSQRSSRESRLLDASGTGQAASGPTTRSQTRRREAQATNNPQSGVARGGNRPNLKRRRSSSPIYHGRYVEQESDRWRRKRRLLHDPPVSSRYALPSASSN